MSSSASVGVKPIASMIANTVLGPRFTPAAQIAQTFVFGRARAGNAKESDLANHRSPWVTESPSSGTPFQM
jgi:hypothetical protein